MSDHFRVWHFSEVLRCPLYGGYRGKSRSDTDIVKLLRMTQLVHERPICCDARP
jgi:hypothetical protein